MLTTTRHNRIPKLLVSGCHELFFPFLFLLHIRYFFPVDGVSGYSREKRLGFDMYHKYTLMQILNEVLPMSEYESGT